MPKDLARVPANDETLRHRPVSNGRSCRDKLCLERTGVASNPARALERRGSSQLRISDMNPSKDYLSTGKSFSSLTLSLDVLRSSLYTYIKSIET